MPSLSAGRCFAWSEIPIPNAVALTQCQRHEVDKRWPNPAPVMQRGPMDQCQDCRCIARTLQCLPRSPHASHKVIHRCYGQGDGYGQGDENDKSRPSGLDIRLGKIGNHLCGGSFVDQAKDRMKCCVTKGCNTKVAQVLFQPLWSAPIFEKQHKR